ncbi:hypothetical protein SVIO_025460 [Streptomyces violaceusniger]|uniref:Uncharacterized protein n=1 Tax=Streptomyces violaceusniger TaxID=68280 RepID=A0A4D4L1Q8_STRVO|nr:hypothetical protein SVIO_025460 [Streptomyces violaceusniger]
MVLGARGAHAVGAEGGTGDDGVGEAQHGAHRVGLDPQVRAGFLRDLDGVGVRGVALPGGDVGGAAHDVRTAAPDAFQDGEVALLRHGGGDAGQVVRQVEKAEAAAAPGHEVGGEAAEYDRVVGEVPAITSVQVREATATRACG